MFQTLRIQNFRSILDSGIMDLGRLNLLLGVNNSGKSSVLATLLMLKQSMEIKGPTTGLVTAGPFVDLGSYFDIMPARPNPGLLQITFSFDPAVRKRMLVLSSEKESALFGPVADSFDFSFRYDSKMSAAVIGSFTILDSVTGQTMAGVADEGKWKISGLPEDLAAHLSFDPTSFFPTLDPAGKKPADESLVDRVVSMSLNSNLLARNAQREFERLLYIGPIRERIQRYGIVGTMSSEMGPSGQNLLRILGRDQGRIVRGRRNLVRVLNEWLESRFGIAKNIRLRNLDRAGTIRALVAQGPEGKQYINLAGTGSGVHQLIPVVVQTVLTPSRGCLLVEQPEIHLHPDAQSTLADLFLSQIKTGDRQFIIETHSEHLLLRIRRRIAEGSVNPEAIRVFYVEKKDGWTKIRRLNLTLNGHFDDWPKGFFEEGYAEAMALARAGTKKG